MRTLPFAVLLLFLALFTGCSSTSQQSDGQEGAPLLPSVNLWPGMKTIDAKPVFPADLATAKPMHAVVDIQSLAYRAITIQYRVIWFDSQGKELNPTGPFKIINMAPGTQSRLDVIDPTGDAVNWRAEFRPAM